MTNPTDAGQRTTDRPKSPAQPDRSSIEQALVRSLDAGPAAIGQQVRYLLALSQMTAAQPSARPRPEKPVTVAQARLVTLSWMAESLNDSQFRSLVKESRQVVDIEVRIRLLTRLALRIPPQNYRLLVRDLWDMIHHLPDPASRARSLFHLIPLLTLVNDEPAAPGPLLEVIALAQSISSTEARVRSLVALTPYLPETMAVRLLTRVLDEVDQINNDSLHCNAIAAISGPLPRDVEERALLSAENIQSPVERARALTALARHLPVDLQPRLRAAALDAIANIRSEEDRAEALINFAPHLENASASEEEFPALLTKALSIAVAMSRRHIRARVLVALAPQLTLDLQGEALAAVHSLGNERDRAMLLAELAPTLPPEMLVASLAVAHTMRQQDARVHALTVLAHHVPENARSQTLLDALAAASNLPHHYERVTALLALIDILPPQLREQAYTNALETTRLIDNENARARALCLLGAYLPRHLLVRTLESAYQIEDLQQRLNALSGIVPYLEPIERENALAHMLECARQMTFEYKRARALVSMAPLLTQPLLHEGMAIADEIDDAYDKVMVSIALAQHMPPEQRPKIINTAWNFIKEIDDGYDRASALAAIAPFLPSEARHDLVQTAGMIIGAIMEEYDQASAISILAPLFVPHNSDSEIRTVDAYAAIAEGISMALSVPQQHLRVELLAEGAAHWAELNDPDQQYHLWRETALRLASLPLADVLLCLGALIPVIQAMAGDDGLHDVAYTLGSH